MGRSIIVISLKRPVPIYYIQYEARPNPESDDCETYGGAFISCWVKSDSGASAKHIAAKSIEGYYWQILSVENDAQEVSENDYLEDKESREHCWQASVDGECYVFHTWPNEPQQESEQRH
jgi:hypothetical protein